TRPAFGIDISDILERHRSAPPVFARGDRVKHRTFGEGVVLDVKGEGPKAEIAVHFSRHGTKRLLAEFAPLEKVT
ncbi:MAG: hypothetical protein QHJ73_07565, partial [Armatimonadota bacterium]|nr:hypothetical protein [Armatimonadota bacterium]